MTIFGALYAQATFKSGHSHKSEKAAAPAAEGGAAGLKEELLPTTTKDVAAPGA